MGGKELGPVNVRRAEGTRTMRKDDEGPRGGALRDETERVWTKGCVGWGRVRSGGGRAEFRWGWSNGVIRWDEYVERVDSFK